jgi:hypothetical protein
VDLKIIPWGIMLLILLRPPMPPQITKLNTVCGKHHWVWWVFHRLVMIPWNNGRMLCFVIGYTMSDAQNLTFALGCVAK